MNPQVLIRSLLPAFVFGVAWLSIGQTIPAWFPKTPPLPPPTGEIIRVLYLRTSCSRPLSAFPRAAPFFWPTANIGCLDL